MGKSARAGAAQLVPPTSFLRMANPLAAAKSSSGTMSASTNPSETTGGGGGLPLSAYEASVGCTDFGAVTESEQAARRTAVARTGTKRCMTVPRRRCRLAQPAGEGGHQLVFAKRALRGWS